MIMISKQELLMRLQERQVNLPEAEGMPYSDLLKIYNSFVVPLDKRVEKRRKESNVDTEDRQCTSSPMEVDGPLTESQTNRIVKCFTNKRKYSLSTSYSNQFISYIGASDTKRIKVVHQ